MSLDRRSRLVRENRRRSHTGMEPARNSAAVLAVDFVADRQGMATPAPATREYVPSGLGLHARTETVVLHALLSARISICRLHVIGVSILAVVQK